MSENWIKALVSWCYVSRHPKQLSVMGDESLSILFKKTTMQFYKPHASCSFMAKNLGPLKKTQGECSDSNLIPQVS